ncbi:hypothetical protein Scep_020309 [Stephania cephalantha]|uniref:Eukaryotic initiation factor 4a n=1 Tax=Stephania cephalantha TaxID=152367 RepID=A0AAP0ICL4_9MAGN
MAIDSIEVASSPSHFNQSRHFYLAVDRLQFKTETLVDLLGVLGRRPSLPIVLCCSTRDELDSVCRAVSALQNISLASLTSITFLLLIIVVTYGADYRLYVQAIQHSDLAESERMLILEKFHQVTVERNRNFASQFGVESEAGSEEHKSAMIVVTDACLPLVASGESSASAHLLINYELPTKKEAYFRRVSTCLAADGIVINMVVGGEVVTLKNLEESIGLVIAEMPIQISEVL